MRCVSNWWDTQIADEHYFFPLAALVTKRELRDAAACHQAARRASAGQRVSSSLPCAGFIVLPCGAAGPFSHSDCSFLQQLRHNDEVHRFKAELKGIVSCYDDNILHGCVLMT